jgi:hypothetical protein
LTLTVVLWKLRFGSEFVRPSTSNRHTRLFVLVCRCWDDSDSRGTEISGIKPARIHAIIAAFQLRRYAATRPSDASTGASLLAFHITELHRRRDLLRSAWRWIVVPIMISFWVILAGFVQARPGSAGTLLTFACIMTVIGLVLSLANIRGARRLQRDIDTLVPLGADLSNSTNRP